MPELRKAKKSAPKTTTDTPIETPISEGQGSKGRGRKSAGKGSSPGAAARGKKAPPLDLESDSGERVSLSDFAGRWLVVYFYPKDNTPGCTREAQGFTEALPRLKKLGAAVVGVSKDSVKSHEAFRSKCDIGFSLLSDPSLATHRAYGAWGTKNMYGKQVEGTIRSTFLVSPSGEIAESWSSVKVDGHVEKVLDALARAKQAHE